MAAGGVALAAMLLDASHNADARGALLAIDFNRAFVAVGLLSVGSALMFWRLAPNAGAEVSGHGRDEAQRAAAE